MVIAAGILLKLFNKILLKRRLVTQLISVKTMNLNPQGVLRGLHFQLAPFAQSKLVRVIEGEVLDVAVDIRQGSPTFGRHVAVRLSGDNKRQLFIPRGFAHGFVVLSDMAIFSYKVDNYYSSECDAGIAYNDPALGIDWLLSHDQLLLSAKDQKQPLLRELANGFKYAVDYYA